MLSKFSRCGELHPSGPINQLEIKTDAISTWTVYTPVVLVCTEMCQTVSEVSALFLERHSLGRFFRSGSALVSTDLAGADNTFVLRLNQEQLQSLCNPEFPAVKRGMSGRLRKAEYYYSSVS